MTELFVFTYTATYYDSLDKSNRKAKGFLVARDYQDAVSKLEYQYGDFKNENDTDFLREFSLHYYDSVDNDGACVFEDIELPEED
jgi:hypothetical protein